MNLDVVGIFSFFGIVMVIFFIWRIAVLSKKKNITMGEYIDLFFNEEGNTLVIFLLLFCYLAEALVATSIHPPNEDLVSIPSRWVMHLTVSFMGFLAATLAPKYAVDALKALKYLSTKKDAKGNIIQEAEKLLFFLLLLICLTFFVGSIFIPYYNTKIIAVGLQRTREFDFAFDKLFYFWRGTAWVEAKYGYPKGTDAFAGMGYNMGASYIVLLVHLLGSLLKGWFAALHGLVLGIETVVDKFAKTQKKQGKQKKEDAKNNKKDEEEEEGSTDPDDEESVLDNNALMGILKFYKPTGTSKWLKEMSEKLISSFGQTQGPAEAAAMSAILTQFSDSIENINRKHKAGELKTTEADEMKENLRQEIYVQFSKPSDEGGFDVHLTDV